ncbi:hypothetical protein BN946_scf185043.g27 [Trametes cinnabarina]|uniref:Uncharacterized protein n=1 Tax=Pycnoporus cinnabarinus TaxID=5643 RepID=A0A060SNG7_PYCCI|nr:hypothetical protein BN946_scf185043.g27 [Trametes cinnabarina]
MHKLFIEEFSNMDMIAPLVTSMTETDPILRPKVSEALDAWRIMQQDIPEKQKSWRVKPRNESTLECLFKDAVMLFKSTVHVPGVHG